MLDVLIMSAGLLVLAALLLALVASLIGPEAVALTVLVGVPACLVAGRTLGAYAGRLR